MEPDSIHVKEWYAGRMGIPWKNKAVRAVIDAVFNDRVRKKERRCGTYSLSFEGTKLSWYSNFLNGMLGNKVQCFFTLKGDSFIVFKVLGNPSAKRFSMPEMKKEYVKKREEDLNEERAELLIKEESVKEEVKEDRYLLQFEGDSAEDPSVKIFEYAVFYGINKVILRAFLKKDSHASFNDVESVCRSIKILDYIH